MHRIGTTVVTQNIGNLTKLRTDKLHTDLWNELEITVSVTLINILEYFSFFLYYIIDITLDILVMNFSF